MDFGNKRAVHCTLCKKVIGVVAPEKLPDDEAYCDDCLDIICEDMGEVLQ